MKEYAVARTEIILFIKKISGERLWRGNEPLGSITCVEFLDWLRKYYLLRDTVPGRV
jgi:hypothetical protein